MWGPTVETVPSEAAAAPPLFFGKGFSLLSHWCVSENLFLLGRNREEMGKVICLLSHLFPKPFGINITLLAPVLSEQ